MNIFCSASANARAKKTCVLIKQAGFGLAATALLLLACKNSLKLYQVLLVSAYQVFCF